MLYGVDSDTLNLTSSTINSSNDITSVDKTYSNSLEGLQVGTIYYARILAQFGTNGLVKRYSTIFAFRTLEEGKTFIDIYCNKFTLFFFSLEQSAYLQFLNHTSTYVSSGSLQACDNCSSETITLHANFAFGKYSHEYAFVSI